MKIFIPALKERIKLTKDWPFPLIHEYRNSSLWEAISGKKFIYHDGRKYADYLANPPIPLGVVLNKGCVLEVDRIYIRKGGEDFNSVSFIILEGFNPVKEGTEIQTFGSGRKHRFWAKLEDVNTIEGDILGKAIPAPTQRYVGVFNRISYGVSYGDYKVATKLKQRNDKKATLKLASRMKENPHITLVKVLYYSNYEKGESEIVWEKPKE